MQTSTSELQLSKVNFYAIHIPLIKDFDLELIFNGPENDPGAESINTFDKLEPGTSIPFSESLILFEKTVSLIQERRGSHPRYFIKDRKNHRQIVSFKMRATMKRGLKDICYYTEKNYTSREISSTNNVFIFSLALNENSEYILYKQPSSIPISEHIEQNLLFMLSFIETKRTHLLPDFITQYKQSFESITINEKKFVKIFYETLDKYLEKKSLSQLEKEFDTVLVLTCVIGLLPKQDKSILDSGYKPFKVEMILEAIQKHVKKLYKAQIQSIVYETLIDGLAFLFIIEENILETGGWLNTVEEFKKNLNFLDEVLERFLTQTSQIEANVQSQSLRRLNKITGHSISLQSRYLSICLTLHEFFEMSRDIVIQNIGSKQEEESDRNIPSKEASMLDQPLCEEKYKRFEEISYLLVDALGKYIEKNQQFNCHLTLENTSQLFQDISKNPSYFTSLFSTDHRIAEMVFSLLTSVSSYDEKRLKHLHVILIQSYNPMLLERIDVLRYLKRAIHQTSGIKNPNFHLTFYSLFVVSPRFDMQAFKELFFQWLTLFEENTDTLYENLDLIYEFFSDDDQLASQKRTLFIQKMIFSLQNEELKDKLGLIISKVKNKELLAAYKDRFTTVVINKNSKFLSNWNHKNPLQVLKTLLAQYPDNQLIQELVQSCMLEISSPDQEEILCGLFDKPSVESKIYMILSVDLFKRTSLFKHVYEVCKKKLEDMQKNNIQVKWIICTTRLEKEERDILKQQMRFVFEENIQQKSSKKVPDIEHILRHSEKEYQAKVARINTIEKFISAYFLWTSDAQPQFETLGKVKHCIEEKTISEIDSQLTALSPFFPDVEAPNPTKEMISASLRRFENNLKAIYAQSNIFNTQESFGTRAGRR